MSALQRAFTDPNGIARGHVVLHMETTSTAADWCIAAVYGQYAMIPIHTDSEGVLSNSPHIHMY